MSFQAFSLILFPRFSSFVLYTHPTVVSSLQTGSELCVDFIIIITEPLGSKKQKLHFFREKTNNKNGSEGYSTKLLKASEKRHRKEKGERLGRGRETGNKQWKKAAWDSNWDCGVFANENISIGMLGRSRRDPVLEAVLQCSPLSEGETELVSVIQNQVLPWVCTSKLGPWTDSIGITQKLVRKAGS